MNQKIYSRLEEIQESLRSTNIFVVIGKKSFELSGAESRLCQLNLKNITYFNNFSPNPKLEDALKGIENYKLSNSDLILAIGGGSIIDMAKLIKGLANSKNHARDVKQNQSRPSQTQTIAIPTTSGSGAESTPFAVVYMDGKKYSLEHPSLLPDEIVLDPTLTYSLPRKQTAVSGIDALCQAVESYWSVNSNNESKFYSKKAIPIILDNLEQAVTQPNGYNRGAMMQAANLAGRAIAIAKTTACHALSYPITTNFKIPHGHAAALTLGEVLEYNGKVVSRNINDDRGVSYVREKILELAKLFKAQSPKEAKTKINSLMRAISLETKLSELDITDYEDIINECSSQRMKNNPRRLEEKDLRNILLAIA